MNSYALGLMLSVNISWFDNKNNISLSSQSKITTNLTFMGGLRLIEKRYYVNNKLHRICGPAYKVSGDLTFNEYYTNDIQYIADRHLKNESIK